MGRTVVKAAVLVTTQVEAVNLGHLAALLVVQGVPILAEVGHEVPAAVAAVAGVHQLKGHQLNNNQVLLNLVYPQEKLASVRNL